jgi:DNA-binding NtrC family response regulator
MPRRILIVDDDESVRFVVRRTLMSLRGDFSIATAEGGREALDQLAENAFDLLITDIRMPGMDGVQLTESIRALDTELVVVWMTGCGWEDVRTAAARLGVGICLRKPLEIGELRASLLAALGSDGVFS